MGIDTMEDEKPCILALRASIEAYRAEIKQEVVDEKFGLSEQIDSSDPQIFSSTNFEETEQGFPASSPPSFSGAPSFGADKQHTSRKTTDIAESVASFSQHGNSTGFHETPMGQFVQRERTQRHGAAATFEDTVTFNNIHRKDFSKTPQEVKQYQDWNTCGSGSSGLNEFAEERQYLIDFDLKPCDIDSKKRHKCDVCGKSFVKQGHLTDHQTIHTGTKPYKCDLCNKSFARKCLISTHLRTHSDERPYKCDECDKTFGHNSNLIVHKRTHSGDRPYKCDVCAMGFMKSGDLVRHKRIHSGERLYQCDACEKTFVRSTSLNIHKRKHSGERPFKCSVCDMSFVTSGHLTRHRKTHSKDKLLIVICGVKNVQK